MGTETRTKESIDKLYEKLSSTYGIQIELETIDIVISIKKISKINLLRFKFTCFGFIIKKFSTYLKNAEFLKFIKSVMLQISDENWRNI